MLHNIQTSSLSVDTVQHLEKLGLDSKLMPKHIAIIMDGNGRWAESKQLNRNKGHEAGVKVLRSVIKQCKDLGVRYLSAYTFSSENWSRPQKEVSFLMNLLKLMLVKEIANLHKNNVRVRIIGNIDSLPKDIIKTIKTIESKTQENSALQLNLMINYGSRSEIIRACSTIIEQTTSDALESMDEATLSQHLLTYDSPDPDILIRPGGEHRLSNFMLWQLSYTELFFLDVLWPDFTQQHLIDVLLHYQKRHRRFGGL